MSLQWKMIKAMNNLLWKVITTITMMIVTVTFASSAAEETLQVGEWKGTFLTHEGTRYKIKYNVKYETESEAGSLMIEMINLDLEPTFDFTYRLTDISIENNKLQFKIPKEFEIKECVLTKENDGYIGTCKSSVGDSTETSEITMYPMKKEIE